MIVDRNVRDYCVHVEASLQEAIQHIVSRRGKVVFAVTEAGVIEGLLTNGDILRLLAASPPPDLAAPVSRCVNRNFKHASPETSREKIEALLEDYELVPLIDERRRLVAVARRRTQELSIGGFALDKYSPTFVIAEIGINHNGSLETAKRLIDASAAAGADSAKFQMRDIKALYSNAGDANDARENLGSQYVLDLVTRFQLTDDEMFAAFDYCKEKGVIPLCTPWDLSSLEKLERYGMDGYKCASADMTNVELLRALAETGKPLIVSTGMSDEDEIRQAVALLNDLGAQYVLLHCNSTYPAPFKDVNLRYLARLREIGGCHVGYSGHERGSWVPVAAVALGAKVVEKHITLDKNMEGNDHKVSLLPDEFADMVRQIRDVEAALGAADARQVTQGEKMNRVNLAKSVIAARTIEEGKVIEREDLAIMSPGRGLQPNRMHELIGSRARKTMAPGDFFYPADVEQEAPQGGAFRFNRPWGLPVRYYDYRQLMEMSNPDFLEFHLSYKDMDIDHHQFFDRAYDLGLVVHSPDLFTGDHLLDLSAEDDAYRKRSIHELQRVVDITRDLKQYFAKAGTPLVIVSPGGFTRDALLPKEARAELYERVADSFDQLDDDGVEVIAQTLPPFPWYFGGQLYLNIFVDPEDTVAFCEKTGRRLCFDISHSKLACNHFGWSFQEFTRLVGPHTAHLHIVDAAGLDNEGLQIDEGEVDFAALRDDLKATAPSASFIPEIWQGHENNGEGFWIALQRLERWGY